MPFSPGTDAEFFLTIIKGSGAAGIIFVMAAIALKALAKIIDKDGSRIDSIVKLESDRWNQKFQQDSTERQRQYDLFAGLLENVSIHTGKLASISTMLEGIPREFSELKRDLGILHGRIDKAFDERSDLKPFHRSEKFHKEQI